MGVGWIGAVYCRGIGGWGRGMVGLLRVCTHGTSGCVHTGHHKWRRGVQALNLVTSNTTSLTFSTSVRVESDEGTGDGPTTGKGANTQFILLPPSRAWPWHVSVCNPSLGNATQATGVRKLEVSQVMHRTVIRS